MECPAKRKQKETNEREGKRRDSGEEARTTRCTASHSLAPAERQSTRGDEIIRK